MADFDNLFDEAMSRADGTTSTSPFPYALKTSLIL
ncbi:head-tail joining protein [Enterobacter hormaechei]|nr:head-tail joining protein [Enterobacter hormaechei]MDE7632955.1 head-tail joining protein [Enterobacter hormaechei]